MKISRRDGPRFQDSDLDPDFEYHKILECLEIGFSPAHYQNNGPLWNVDPNLILKFGVF